MTPLPLPCNQQIGEEGNIAKTQPYYLHENEREA